MAHDKDHVVTFSDVETATEAALECLAWSTPSSCVYSDAEPGIYSAYVCIAHAAQNEHPDVPRSIDSIDLPEMLDDTDNLGFSFEARAWMRALVEGFIQENSDDLDGLDYGQIGHDLVLTANHHGAGFWDRGLGDRGQRLTDAAHPHGSIDAYLGADRFLHIEGE